MKRSHRSVSAPGFTLVELQVALLLVAMISVLLVGTLQLSASTWNKVTERQDVAEQHYLLTSFLRRHLSNARFTRVRTEDGAVITGFLGDQRQVHFIAPFPLYRNSGDLYWWSLKLLTDEKNTLVLDYMPYNAQQTVELLKDGSLEIKAAVENSEPLAPPARLLLSENIEVLEFDYFYRDIDDREDWVDEWEGGDEVPLVIRLRLAELTPDNELAWWPELSVSPRFANQQLFGEGVK